jgi:uncharacterized caspase-like protein
MAQHLLRALILCCIGAWFGPTLAFAEERLALVIGNSAYRTVTALPNPANDAKAMVGMLTSAGFEITEAPDLTQSDMRRAIRDFAAKISQKGPNTVALVFYAGHGVQVDGENYLVPVDARIEREADLAIEAVRLADVMNALNSVPSKARIVILDACRNNPFSDIVKNTGRGLAIVDAPRGSFVSYSTAPGAVATDGAGNNSPFTTALIEVARTPGLPIELAFRQVRTSVDKTTNGGQTPWDSSSLIGDFVFFPGDKSAARSDEPRAAQPVAFWTARMAKRAPADAFEIALRADVVEAYEAYMALFGASPMAPRVRAILDRRLVMVAWFSATTANSVAAYEAFLLRFPNTDLTATAQRLLQRARNRALAAGAQASVGNAQAAVSPPSAAPVTPVRGTARSCECPELKPLKPTRVREEPTRVREVVVQEVVPVRPRPNMRPYQHRPPPQHPPQRRPGSSFPREFIR